MDTFYFLALLLLVFGDNTMETSNSLFCDWDKSSALILLFIAFLWNAEKPLHPWC